MKSLTVFIFILSGITCKGQSQNGLDSLLATLDNKDLYVAPIIRGVYIGIRNEKSAQTTICSDRRSFIVSSLDEDIQQLSEKYSKKILTEKLIALLQDTARDFYANALLYDLLENKKLGKLFSMKREEWVNNGRRTSDTQYWKEYAQKPIYYF